MAFSLSWDYQGQQSILTARSSIQLSRIYFYCQKLEEAESFLTLGISLLDQNLGEYNFESLSALKELLNISIIDKKTELQEKIITQLLNRGDILYGPQSEYLIAYLEKLAELKAVKQDFDKATLYQSRHTLRLKKIIQTNATLTDAQKESLETKLQDSIKLKNIYLKSRV